MHKKIHPCHPWFLLSLGCGRSLRCVLLMVLLVVSMAEAKVTLPPVISSHMVLQRDMAVPIWGAADRGETVTVKFRNQQKQTTAGADGKWIVKLDPLKAGGPDVLTVNDMKLDDVLVGEVWVGSGQSNMQTLTGTLGATTLRFGTDNSGLTSAQVASITYLGKSVIINAQGYVVLPASGGTVFMFW